MNELEARELANALYGAIIHRAPDAGGLEFWANNFKGMSRTEALFAFIFSAAPESGDLQKRVIKLEQEVKALKAAKPVVTSNVIHIDPDVNEIANEVADILVNRLAN